MYTSFHIKNFRGFEELEIGPLDRVNLIAGKNNVGKTSLLEAIWLHNGAGNPDHARRIDLFRGFPNIDSKEFMATLFYNLDRGLASEIKGYGDWGSASKELRMFIHDRSITEVALGSQSDAEAPNQQAELTTAQSSGEEIVFEFTNDDQQQYRSSGWITERQVGPAVVKTFQVRPTRIPKRGRAVYMPARLRTSTRDDAQRLGDLERRGDDQMLVTSLREIEPRLERLTIIPIEGQPTIFGAIGLPSLIPLPLMGDGITQLLSIALSIANAPEGIVLIDEVENGLHHSVLTKVWKAIATFARKYDVQVFATTHSYECIQAAHEAFEQNDTYDFRLHRLERIKGKIEAITYSQRSIEASIANNWEIR